MPHTFGSASVHYVIISHIDSKQVTYSPCEHYRKKEHIILLLFVHFFLSHIGHHLPFISNTMLTVKSHIPTTQRGEKQAVWAPWEGEEQWNGFWGGGGEQKRVASRALVPLKSWWSLALQGLSLPSCPEVLLHSRLASFIYLLTHLLLHSFIQYHVLNCLYILSGINL
jgi:hypothetical protein